MRELALLFTKYALTKQGGVLLHDAEGFVVICLFLNKQIRTHQQRIWNPNGKYRIGSQRLLCRHIALAIERHIVDMSDIFSLPVLIACLNEDANKVDYFKQILSHYYTPDKVEVNYALRLFFNSSQMGFWLYQMCQDMQPGDFKHMIMETPNHAFNFFIQYKAAKYGKPQRFLLIVLEPNTINVYREVAVAHLDALLLVKLQHFFDDEELRKYQADTNVIIDIKSIADQSVKSDVIQIALLDHALAVLQISGNIDGFAQLFLQIKKQYPKKLLTWMLHYDLVGDLLTYPSLMPIIKDLLFHVEVEHFELVLNMFETIDNSIHWKIDFTWPPSYLYYKPFLEGILLEIQENTSLLDDVIMQYNDIGYLLVNMLKRVLCANLPHMHFSLFNKGDLLKELNQRVSHHKTVGDILEDYFPLAMQTLKPYLKSLVSGNQKSFYASLPEQLFNVRLKQTRNTSALVVCKC